MLVTLAVVNVGSSNADPWPIRVVLLQTKDAMAALKA